MTPSAPAVLLTALRAFADQPHVLVAVDFDGTLAPFTDQPMDARAVPGALDVLIDLSALPQTTVAVVSGRDLASLRILTGHPDDLVLVGSHGAEPSWDSTAEGHRLTSAEQNALNALDNDVEELRSQHPLARIEEKPSARVLHTRGLAEALAADINAAGMALADRHEHFTVTAGKDVLEFAVANVGKGPALLDLAQEVNAGAILFAGDDTTDELAFECLSTGDVTVKVGPGDTEALHRVADELAVVEMLQELLALRHQSVGR